MAVPYAVAALPMAVLSSVGDGVSIARSIRSRQNVERSAQRSALASSVLVAISKELNVVTPQT